MAKSFKKFREEYDDEWGNDDRRVNEKKKMQIRDERRKKAQERFSSFEENSHEND
jgi:hypothetical protein